MRTEPGSGHPHATTWFAAALLAAAGSASAACPDPAEPACAPDSGWVTCAAPLSSPVMRPDPAERLRAELTVDAGRADYLAGEQIELGGGFTMTRADQRLSGEQAVYDRGAGTVEASGSVSYRETGLVLHGSGLAFDIERDAGSLDDVRFALPQQHLRGTAAHAAWDGQETATFSSVTYTGCDPGDNGWLLSADEITIDQAEGWGEARDAVVRVKGVPVFYAPRLPFPIDDRRRSGLLIPSFGYSEDGGVDLAVPWYWNIAPNRDATLTPRLLSERGLQLNGEFRYLYRPDGQPVDQEGQLEVSILPDDDEYGDTRAAVDLHHDGRPAPGWEVGVAAGWVSDDDYLRDLGGSLELASTTHVRRELRVAHESANWSLRGFASYLQALDDSRPYQPLPQFEVELHPAGYGPLHYGLRNELVHFSRSDRPDGFEDVTGTRVDVEPWVAAEWAKPWGYLRPRVALRHTRWALDDGLAGSDDDPTRTLPVTSVDAGLFFERPLDSGLTQTLEPRLFYLNVPYDDQDDLIRDRDGNAVVFDSIDPQLNLDELFQENRFTGADRVGDANQLALAVTSRWLDGGRERARIGIGQVLYFRDRKVTLPGQARQTDDTSPLVAEARAELGGGFAVAGALNWDPHDEETDLGAVTIDFRPASGRLARLGYRRVRGEIEQTDVAISWPLGDSWHAVGRWNYSLRASTSLETFAGIEYKSCCWSARVLVREFANDTLKPDDKDLAVMFQFELKGLSRVGQNIGQFLTSAIPGYRETD